LLKKPDKQQLMVRALRVGQISDKVLDISPGSVFQAFIVRKRCHYVKFTRNLTIQHEFCHIGHNSFSLILCPWAMNTWKHEKLYCIQLIVAAQNCVLFSLFLADFLITGPSNWSSYKWFFTFHNHLINLGLLCSSTIQCW
jgi:hypothetical protein